MFDIGFWELVTLAVITLLIVGPERLPKVARDAGKLTARIRRFINHTRLELERELDIEERRDLQQSIDHVDRLMKDAPDRLLNGEENKTPDKPD